MDMMRVRANKSQFWLLHENDQNGFLWYVFTERIMRRVRPCHVLTNQNISFYCII